MVITAHDGVCNECVTFYTRYMLQEPGDLDAAAFRKELIDPDGHKRPPAPLRAPRSRFKRISDDEPRCSFCGKPEREVRKIAHGKNATICDECLVSTTQVIRSHNDLIDGDAFLSQIVGSQEDSGP